VKIEQHTSDFAKISTQVKQRTVDQKKKLLEMKRLLEEVEACDNESLYSGMDELNDALLSAGSDKIKAFNERNSLVLGEKVGCLKNFADSQTEMHEKLSKQLKTTADTAREHDERVKTILAQQIEATSANETRFKQQLTEVEAAVKAKNKQSLELDTAASDGIAEQTKSESGRSLVKSQEVKSLVQQTLTGLVKDTEANVNSKLMKCTEEIDAFQQSKVFKYQPTGETPVRKEFTITRMLTATSPHGRIIKRYRTDLGFAEDSQLDSSIVEVSWRMEEEFQGEEVFDSIGKFSNQRRI
jgi:hypothetical protein